jgi:hypothetical protein
MGVFPPERKVSSENGLVIPLTPYRFEMVFDDLSNIPCQLLLLNRAVVSCIVRGLDLLFC